VTNDWKAHQTAADEAVAAGDETGAWLSLQPLVDHRKEDTEAARFLAVALTNHGLDLDRRLELADALLSERIDDEHVPRIFGDQLESFVDMRYLNDAPPTHPFFGRLLEVLARHFDKATGEQGRVSAAFALAHVARLSGRSADVLCERVHQELLRLEPNKWQNHYNYGLFLKTRGRFADGARANQRAMELAGDDVEPVFWNLGICATGAGQGDVALGVWRERVSFKGALGEDGLPAGKFHQVKVRVAQRPLSERSAAADSPGTEETLWLERLSPCHGRVLSPPFSAVGVEYGDLVLFDGAPITKHEVDGREVPVFPQLATIRRSGWRVFQFAGRQITPGQIGDLSEALPGDSVLYPHTERMRFFCKKCWESGGDGAAHAHSTERKNHTIVRGKFCVDPAVSLSDVDRVLGQLLQSKPGVVIACPDFQLAAGNARRAAQDSQEFERLADELEQSS
jgi:hypothetical protein